MAKIEKIRHSLAHILTLAVQELFSGVKFGKSKIQISGKNFKN